MTNPNNTPQTDHEIPVQIIDESAEPAERVSIHELKDQALGADNPPQFVKNIGAAALRLVDSTVDRVFGDVKNVHFTTPKSANPNAKSNKHWR